MALSCIISEIKRVIGRKLRFFRTLLHSTPPPGGGVPVGILPYRWYKKTTMVWLPDSEKAAEQ